MFKTGNTFLIPFTIRQTYKITLTDCSHCKLKAGEESFERTKFVLPNNSIDLKKKPLINEKGALKSKKWSETQKVARVKKLILHVRLKNYCLLYPVWTPPKIKHKKIIPIKFYKVNQKEKSGILSEVLSSRAYGTHS